MADRQGVITDIKRGSFVRTLLGPPAAACTLFRISQRRQRSLPACYCPLPATACPTCYCLPYLLLSPASYCLAYLLLPPACYSLPHLLHVHGLRCHIEGSAPVVVRHV